MSPLQDFTRDHIQPPDVIDQQQFPRLVDTVLGHRNPLIPQSDLRESVPGLPSGSP